MEIRHDYDGITFSDDWGQLTFKNEEELMNSLGCAKAIVDSNKTIYMTANPIGRSSEDAIDAMMYAYNDILTTQHHIASLPTTIQRVIFDGPATIVIWGDGSKTIVKCSEDDTFDPEKGLAMAICKKILGHNFKATFKKWLPEEKIENISNEMTRNISEAFQKLIDLPSKFNNKNKKD